MVHCGSTCTFTPGCNGFAYDPAAPTQCLHLGVDLFYNPVQGGDEIYYLTRDSKATESLEFKIYLYYALSRDFFDAICFFSK